MKKTTKLLKDQAVILDTVKSYSAEEMQQLLISRMRLAALELATKSFSQEGTSKIKGNYSHE